MVTETPLPGNIIYKSNQGCCNMTCNIGFKSCSNNIFIAADNRIVWDIPKKGDKVHVDDLQKIYFPTPNVVISFAGNYVKNIKNVLEKFSNQAREKFQYKIKNARVTYNYNDSIERLIKRILKTNKIKEKIYLLVGISFPKHCKNNKLLKFIVSDDGIDEEKEISSGDYCVVGSIKNENKYIEFKKYVLENTFIKNKNLDICQYSSLFNSKYLNFYNNLDKKFKTVGALFHSVHSRNGIFIGSDSEMGRIHKKEKLVKASMIYNPSDSSFTQINHNNNENFKLISLTDYDFADVPKNSKLFKLI